DGEWGTEDCTEQKSLFCYSAEYQKHILVKRRMSWVKARRYCRTNYTDLSSIKSNEENINVSRLLEEGSDDKAWIGLHRHFWTWSDGSSAPYRRFAKQQSHNNKNNCVMMDSNQWHSEECTEELSFICYKDESVLYTDQKHTALKTVKVRLRVGSADLSDPELQDAILRQLQQKLEEAGVTQEVKLSWRRSPDGNISPGRKRGAVRGSVIM
ncbi:Aggrecan core protein, partial [Dissostichus eleginoides]